MGASTPNAAAIAPSLWSASASSADQRRTTVGGSQPARPKSSSRRSMSPSPKYSPCCTSMKTRVSSPQFAMGGGAARDVDRLSGAQLSLMAIERDYARARDHEPVLGSALVALEAEASAWVNLDPLHLVRRRVLKDLVGPPRSLITFSDHVFQLSTAAARRCAVGFISARMSIGSSPSRSRGQLPRETRCSDEARSPHRWLCPA